MSELVNEGYVGELPVSPNGTGTWDEEYSGYYLVKSPIGTLTIGACEMENEEEIIVIR